MGTIDNKNLSSFIQDQEKESRYSFTSYKPELIDNETLLEANDNLIDAQSISKEASRKLAVTQAAINDTVTNAQTSELNLLRADYIDDTDFNENALPLYLAVCNLCEMLTPRQLRIIKHYVVDRMTINEIAKLYKISAPGVLKSISLTQKKSKKLNIGGLL